MTLTLTVSHAPEETCAVCAKCGTGLPIHSEIASETQKQIEDLQAQVRLLTQKATAAVDKWADYEDEIQQLRAQQQQQGGSDPAPTPSAQHSIPFDDRPDSPARSIYHLPIQNRLSSFLTARKATGNFRAQQLQPPASPSTTDLVAALTREQNLRQAAEGKLDEASGELEELSAQLFQEANEMVAAERKARAKLEERVEVLERRDGEKRKRLERLEGAVQRIERVRGLLAPQR